MRYETPDPQTPSEDAAKAARAIMRELAHQANLYGSWTDTDWRIIWDQLLAIADAGQPDKPRSLWVA